MPRKSNAKERRAEIAHALFRCIARRGYLNTSTRDIAREANLNQGLIHYYFESKEDILQTMAEDVYCRSLKAFEQYAHKYASVPPRERLTLISKFLHKKVADDKDLARVFHELWSLAHTNERVNESLQSFYRLYRKYLAEILSDVFKDLALDTDDARDLADILISLGGGASVLRSVGPRGLSLSRMTKLTTRLLESFFGLEESSKTFIYRGGQEQ